MWWWPIACVSEPVPDDQLDLRVLERPWVDGSRQTPSFGTWEGAPERSLPTRVWIGPALGEDAPHRPLLLMAHGLDGHPRKFEAFASDLARAGVVVAAPAFPSSNDETGAGFLGVGDLGEQPGDLTFVLDRLLEEVEDPASELWHRFDPEAIVVLGHSLGGATVLGWTRFEDPETRLDGVATLSPAVPLTVVFGPSPSPDGLPTLMMHGTEDP
ncbi:MAG: alpha/beta hydrolase, partial [Myxococcales bacterium]|nr:alpha/beta hydrolase [Myxococcales bacterium]